MPDPLEAREEDNTGLPKKVALLLFLGVPCVLEESVRTQVCQIPDLIKITKAPAVAKLLVPDVSSPTFPGVMMEKVGERCHFLQDEASASPVPSVQGTSYPSLS